jgi:hypothetical protein
MKKCLEYLVSELFSNRKCCGLRPWLGRPRLLWLTVNKGARGGGSSSELGLMATLEHGSSPAGAQQREGNMGIPAWASPGLEWRWRGGTVEVTNGGGLSSERGQQKARGSSRERGKGAVRAGVLITFYRDRREVEVAKIGGAAEVNDVLNGAINRVKEGEEMRSSKGG